MKTIVTLLLLVATAHTSLGAEYVCTKKNGSKIRVTDCRQVGPVLTPTPSPAPTFSPLPFDCSGGTFVKITPTTLQWVNRVYPRGESVHLCANVPTTQAMFMTLSSTNRSNVSCNVMNVRLTSPSGKVYETESVQPGVAMSLEPGKWSLVATLTDKSPCSTNYPFDFYLSWF